MVTEIPEKTGKQPHKRKSKIHCDDDSAQPARKVRKKGGKNIEKDFDSGEDVKIEPIQKKKNEHERQEQKQRNRAKQRNPHGSYSTDHSSADCGAT